MIRPLLALVAILAVPAAANERGFAVADFTRIRVEGPYQVIVATGRRAAVTAEGSARDLAGILLRVDAGTLYIRPANREAGTDGPVVFQVAAPGLTAATLIGGGALRIDRMAGEDVRVTLNGTGDLEIGTVAADRMSAMATGTGRMTLGGQARRALVGSIDAPRIDGDALVVRDLAINAQGGGALSLRATETARVIAVGPAVVAVRGGAKCTVSGQRADVQCGDDVAPVAQD